MIEALLNVVVVESSAANFAQNFTLNIPLREFRAPKGVLRFGPTEAVIKRKDELDYSEEEQPLDKDQANSDSKKVLSSKQPYYRESIHRRMGGSNKYGFPNH